MLFPTYHFRHLISISTARFPLMTYRAFYDVPMYAPVTDTSTFLCPLRRIQQPLSLSLVGLVDGTQATTGRYTPVYNLCICTVLKRHSFPAARRIRWKIASAFPVINRACSFIVPVDDAILPKHRTVSIKLSLTLFSSTTGIEAFNFLEIFNN